MKHLVTGSGGFVGTHLLSHLRARQPKAELVSVGLHAPRDPSIRHLNCDLRDPVKTTQCLESEKPDHVYHLAGSARVSQEIGMPEYFAHNTLTTQNLIQGLMAVSKPFRVFFASSVHVYGNQSSEADESSEVTPEGYYGMSKYLSERALEEFAKQRPDIRVVVGRLYSCIGPNQPPGFVTSDLTTKLASLTNNSLLETGPLSAYRRFLDVRDAVEILVRLVESDQTNGFEIVNIASPFEMKVQEIVEKLVAVSGKKVRIQSRETDQNPFKGLKISLRKQEKLVPGFSFRPLETTLQDIWNSVHIRESA